MAHFLRKCVSLTHIVRARRPLYASSLLHFSTSSTVLQRRQRIAEDMSRRTRSILEDDLEDLWDQIEEPSDIEDSPSVGHLVLQQQRLLLNYMRLIEHEMPKLVGEYNSISGEWKQLNCAGSFPKTFHPSHHGHALDRTLLKLPGRAAPSDNQTCHCCSPGRIALEGRKCPP